MIKGKSHYLKSLLLLVALIWGCTAASVVPTGYREARNLVMSKEHVFYAPMEETLAALTLSLMDAGLQVNQVAYFKGKGKVEAQSPGIHVKVVVEEVAPKLTKTLAKVTRKNSIVREFAIEESLFHVTEKWLEQPDRLKGWQTKLRGMAKVYYEPNTSSKVVGYVRPGTEVEVVEKKNGWAKLKLVDGGYGYVQWTGKNYQEKQGE